MKTNFALLCSCFLLLASFNLQAQEASPEKPIKVYLLGTFHFGQVEPEEYDIRSAEHQASIQALCDLIIQQKPDKVFTERQPEYEFQNDINGKYAQFLEDGKPPYRNEIYEVGFRIAAALDHPQVYQCDHPGMWGSHYKQTLKYARANDQVDLLNGTGRGTLLREDEIANEDSIMANSSLLDYIRWINSDAVMSTSHANYLTTFTQVGSTDYYNYDDDNTLIGAELVADWYRRNILMYSKMINQLDYTEEAIFLVVGGDHVPILTNLFRDNPFFEVVHPKEWLY
ncbi:MAG: DUF5694 domain-containing protein [Bacteroidota bacterium]